MRYCDLHNDLLTHEKSEDCGYTKAILEQYADSGVDSVVLAVWTTESRIDNWSKIKGIVCPFLRYDGVRVRVAIEDISCLSDYEIMTVGSIEPAYVSLTWNYANSLAGGAYSDTGMTERGRSVVEMLHRQGILIDTAHLNAKSFYELVDTPDIKLINSHTAFDAVTRHPRNITHDQARMVIMRGGLIGLALVGDFLSSKGRIGTVDDAVRHIDWFAERFGCSHLALGTDYYGSDNIVNAINNYDRLGILVEKLQKMGYNNDCIENIMYKNFYEYYEVSNAVRHL